MDIDLARMREQLELHEGKRKKPYKDTVGKTTIGVGRNLEARGLLEDEIQLLLTNDIRDHLRALEQALPWVSDLDEVRQRVVLDMAFNMGIGGLLGFKNTLAAIRRRDYDTAADGMLRSKWADQVGARAARLATMMRTGKDFTV